MASAPLGLWARLHVGSMRDVADVGRALTASVRWMRRQHDHGLTAIVCASVLVLAACAADSPNDVTTGATATSTVPSTTAPASTGSTVGAALPAEAPAASLGPFAGLDLPAADIVITAAPGDGPSEAAAQRILAVFDQFAIEGSINHVATFASPSGPADVFSWKSGDPELAEAGDERPHCSGTTTPTGWTYSCSGPVRTVDDEHFGTYFTDGRVVTATGTGFADNVIAVDLLAQGFRVRSQVIRGFAFFEFPGNPGGPTTATMYYGNGELEELDLPLLFPNDVPPLPPGIEFSDDVTDTTAAAG